MKQEIFRFKQFEVDQSGCAMKINTDGVLLGALTEADHPQNILDIGAGTGVIALMLAQRFQSAFIDAVEIDEAAAVTAGANLKNSPFSNRLSIYAESFEEHFEKHPDKKYDLIVSNPPFHIYSLESKGALKALARHTDEAFFERILKSVSIHLSNEGSCWLVLPLQTSALVQKLAEDNGLSVNRTISISSYPDSPPHREILVLSTQKNSKLFTHFTIYSLPKEYTPEYREKLKDFLLIFG